MTQKEIKQFEKMKAKADKLKEQLTFIYNDMAGLFEDGSDNWDCCMSAAIDAENCGARISDIVTD